MNKPQPGDDPQATYERVMRLAAINDFEREASRVNQEFSRLPNWRQEQLEGDYKQDVMEPKED